MDPIKSAEAPSGLECEHINITHLVRFSGLRDLDENPGLISEIIDIFLRTTPQTFGRLEKAVAAQNFEEVRRTVHSLKGTVGSFGAVRLAQMCVDLDREIKQGKRDGFEDPVAEILVEYACACEDLHHIRQRLG